MNRSHRSNQSGFSLVELMVALTAGGILVAAAYTLGGASSRHFQEQQRVAIVQSSVRLAADALQRDIQRAGYLGTANSMKEQRCVAPATEIQAIEFQDNQGTAALSNAGQNGVNADLLRLTGSYASGDAFFAWSINATGDQIFLQDTWQGFRRQFSPSGGATDVTAFQAMFLPGRVLAIRALTGATFFVTIAANGADATNNSIRFAPALPLGGPCLGGLGTGAIVSVLSRIEYSVNTLGNFTNLGSLVPLNGNSGAMGIDQAVLVRQELNFADNGVFMNGANPANERVVLENVADFSLDFYFDNNGANLAAAPALTFALGAAAANRLQRIGGNPAVVPELVRSVLFSISAHTPDQDPTFPWVARAAGDPLTRFRVNPAMPGASRVRTIRSEVTTPNLLPR